MSYVRKIFGLGVLSLIVLSVLIVPMALAHGTEPNVNEQSFVSNIGMLQETPTATGTVEADEDDTDADAATTPAVEPDAATTPVVEPDAATTPAVEPDAATTPVVEPGAEQQQAPGALPQTGAVTTPSTGILLVVIGALILAGGLGLALTRRRS